MPDILAGKTCLITGASRGLGAHLAAAFWAAGASLLLVARSRPALERVAATLPARPGQRVAVLPADLADPLAPESVVAEARKRSDGLAVLVNDAALQGPIGPLWENDWRQWQATLQLNLLAPVALCRACVPWLALAERGKIVNIAGGGATSPRPRFSAYATAKAGLVRFSETLAQETRELGIDVNCVAPGALATDMTAAIVQAGPDAAGEQEYAAACRRQAKGDGLAAAADLCLFLASAASDGITGKLISAVWDPWTELAVHRADLAQTDVYTLRRIVPRERGLDWG